MVTVGVREFRSKLRSYLERAARGEEVIVTERGKPIATVVPASGSTTYQRMVAEGRIRPANRPKTPIDRKKLPRVRGNAVSDILIRQRGSEPLR